ncbi:16S rRNA (guanine(966)-N(2))-methyltransferase RsmD [Clostridium sp. 19966]|uniref:16S rRNA (guanine(966)-N(2))-methyltransferase RsmD n=1 Tax=Clostridium sp. 19966 TaxID=2768166 RepID=UPI0028DEED53|nr:16S rRNA (guanine(966)-N(2))-methyltransferase RsmD [Clostridium sp. 19966]MDT8716463.1 16S rRNA (guanine(966)-N(2))-methyltransferase RsmD [Clostridium sp. 19966]
MRVIAGIAKGRNLLPPEGMQTRPTLDRVKEAMFNIIQNKVPFSRALDVFAGTGSLGLEAVSRGAKSCILVDKHSGTFSLLKKNVTNLGFEDKCRCLNMDSYDVLNFLGKEGEKLDLIFIDPPYLKNMIPKAIELVFNNGLLNYDGLIVTKIDSTEEIYEGYLNLKLINYRKYGHTIVCFYKYFIEE